MAADVFDQVAESQGSDVFDVAEGELARQQKSKERVAALDARLEKSAENDLKSYERGFDDSPFSESLGRVLTRASLTKGGKAGDVALGVTLPLVGAVAGGLLPVPGGAAGGGAISSGVSDALVQEREYLRGERDNLSKGRLLTSTGTGALVPPGVKAAATPALTAGKTLLVRAGQGAGLGAVHEAGSELIDEGKIHGGSILSSALMGTVFGGAFGALEAAAPHVIKAIRGKTVEQAKAVITEELNKIDTATATDAMDAAKKAEVRGVLEGAQKRIDEMLGIKPEGTGAPTADNTAIGAQDAAEKVFGGEAPLTRIQKADERAAGVRQGRAEVLRDTLVAGQIGEGESTALTGDEVRNQLTKLETRPGEARRERSRLLAKEPEKPVVPDDVPANVELTPQANRLLAAEGYETPPPLVRARPPAVTQNKPKVKDDGLARVLEEIGGNEPVGAPGALGGEGQPIEDTGTVLAPKTEKPPGSTAADQLLPTTPQSRGNASAETAPAQSKQGSGEQTIAEQKPKSKRIGLPADGEMDILNHIQELGGIKHPDKLSENNQSGGEYNGFKEMMDVGGLPRTLVRRDGGGRTPDQLVAELAERGVTVRDADHFFEEIEKARVGRGVKKAQAGNERYVARWENAFLGDNAKLESGGKVITVDDLRVGQTFTVNKEKFTVTKIDDEGFVTVKDGITRELAPGTRIFPDKGKIKGGGKKVPDFLPPEEQVAAANPGKTPEQIYDASLEEFRAASRKFTEAQKAYRTKKIGNTEFVAAREEFDAASEKADVAERAFIEAKNREPKAPEPVAEKTEPFNLASATNEQQAAEAAAQREKLLAQKQRDEIAARAEKPLTGDSSDVGQGTLLAQDEDLLSGPSAETLSKRKPMADRGGLEGRDLESGKVSPRLLFSTPIQSLVGGAAGAAYGSTQGDTLEERRQNMLLYGAGGAALGASARIAGKAILNRMAAKPVYEIDKHLAPPPGKPIGEKLSELPTNVKAATLSIFAPLDKLDDDVRKGASWLYLIPKRELPLSREFEQVAGATGKAAQDVRDYARNVLDAVGEADRQNFDRIVALKRIEQRLAWNDANASDRKVVGDWTHAKVAADIAKLEADIGAKRVGELDSIASGIMQREADDALQLQVQSGRLSQESYDKIKAENDFYAPFKVLDHLEDIDTGGGRAVDTRDQLAKVIEGIHSTDFHIENPSVALAQHIFKGRVLAEKNVKMLKLAELADNDVSGTLIRKLEAHDEPRRGYETVNYFANGKPMRLEVKRDVAEAVKGLNAAEVGWVANFARNFSSLFRFGATTGNLAFQPVNFALADQPNLWLVSKYGLNGAKDVYRAPLDFAHGVYASIYSNILGGEGGTFAKVGAKIPGVKQTNEAAAKLARAFNESGATGSNWQELVDTMGGTVDEKKLLGSLKLGEHSLLDSIGSVNKAIEESTKMMGFKRGLRIEGIDKMSPAQAEEALKKVVAEVRNFAGSPDFMRSGYATRDLNNLLQMFLNARVQGVTNLTGRLAGADGAEAARNAWLRIGATIGTGAGYLWYQNHRSENEADYNARSETERRNYFLFPRNDENGQPLYSTNEFGQKVREYWRLPKREVLQYMGNTVESALDFAYDKDPDAVKKYGEQMIENLSPVNISGKTGRERMESVVGGANPLLKIPYEQLSGRDTFRHRDILPTDDLKRASPENQYVETTPKLLVRAAHAMPNFAPDNLRSPMLLQNLVEGASGRALTQFLPKQQPEGRDPTAAAVASNPLTSRLAGSLYVDRSAEQGEIDTLKRGEADLRVEKRRTARETIAELKQMDAAGVATRLKEIAATRPEMFEAIMTEINRTERDVIDRQLLGLGVKNGARAQFIANQIKKLNDPEKVKDYLLRISQGDEAPLTPEVFEQVTALLSSQ